jgi:hypothetical protein
MTAESPVSGALCRTRQRKLVPTILLNNDGFASAVAIAITMPAISAIVSSPDYDSPSLVAVRNKTTVAFLLDDNRLASAGVVNVGTARPIAAKVPNIKTNFRMVVLPVR